MTSAQKQTFSAVRKLLACDNVEKLISIIREVVPAYSYGRGGLFICELPDPSSDKGDPIRFFLKIAPWVIDFAAIGPDDSSVETEIAAMRAIKTKIIDSGASPHLAEILAVGQCANVDAILSHSKEECEAIARGESQPPSAQTHANDAIKALLCRHREREGMSRAPFAMIFSEICGISLSMFIQERMPICFITSQMAIWTIFFQVYWTLMVLGRAFPGMHHGDLHCRNVMILATSWPFNPVRERQMLRYEANGRAWCVPYDGFIVKIIDFGHTNMPSESIRTPAFANFGGVRPDRLPDHCLFLMDLSQSLEIKPQLAQLFIRQMSVFNPHKITMRVAARIVVDEFAKDMPTPESVFLDDTFAMFPDCTKDPADTILRTYRAPSASRSDGVIRAAAK